MEMMIENDKLKIKCHPGFGGKITSFFYKENEFELAAQTDKSPELRSYVENEFAPYAFGMDDAFPNIDEEKIHWKGKDYVYPDHGEVWRAEFEVTDQTNDSVCLCWKSPGLGYRYEKKLYLKENGLHICYHITNEGAGELPCIWTWHGLMRYEEDMEIILPQGITHCRNVLSGTALGEAGRIYSLENNVYHFTKVPKIESRSMVKFYAEGAVKCGRCGLYYPSQDMTCIMEYDAEVLPYFGFWVTAGGFQGDYNCALEPSNGFYDSISRAGENKKLPILGIGENIEFEIRIALI